jgi:hypothetical protein
MIREASAKAQNQVPGARWVEHQTPTGRRWRFALGRGEFLDVDCFPLVDCVNSNDRSPGRAKRADNYGVGAGRIEEKVKVSSFRPSV